MNKAQVKFVSKNGVAPHYIVDVIGTHHTVRVRASMGGRYGTTYTLQDQDQQGMYIRPDGTKLYLPFSGSMVQLCEAVMLPKRPRTERANTMPAIDMDAVMACLGRVQASVKRLDNAPYVR